MNKKKIFLVVDTETCNGFDNPLVYNLGCIAFTSDGEVVFTKDYLIKEVYYDLPCLMKTAYYAYKKPLYEEFLKRGLITVASLAQAKRELLLLCKDYNITTALAYNARFDIRALNLTWAFVCGIEEATFLQVVEWYDIWPMVKDCYCLTGKYKSFCDENDYYTANGIKRTTAEIVTRYLNNDNDFVENHTALLDCMCEKDIFTRCMKRKKGYTKYRVATA